MRRTLSSLVALSALSGCATIVTGTHEAIVLQTSPPGASCQVLHGGMAVGTVVATPGAVLVPKSGEGLDVSCSKPGYRTAQASQAAGLQPWLFGNAVIGGLIGVGVDFASGAAFHYSPTMNLALGPQSTTPYGAPYASSAIDPDAGAARGEPRTATAANPLIIPASSATGDVTYRWGQTRAN